MAEKKNSPLSNHLLYDGDDIDDARKVLSNMFNEVSLEPLDTRKPYRSLVYGVELPQSAVGYIKFESGVKAGPVDPMGFHTLQLNPVGSALYHNNDGDIPGSAREGVILSAGQTVKNNHYAGNGNLVLNVSDEVLRNFQSMWTGKTQKQMLKFKSGFDTSSPQIASFLNLTDVFIKELNRPGGILEIPAAVASFESALLTTMLFSFEHQFSEQMGSKVTSASFKQVRNIEDYIESHASQPVDMASLATISGLSGATIHRAFRKHRDYTPMQFLKQTRMRLANQRLLMARSTDSVTRIAMECGFTHLGRFAVEYRQRFGEEPSRTFHQHPPTTPEL